MRQEKEQKAQEQRLAEQRQRMLEERHRDMSVSYSQSPQLSNLTNLPTLYSDPLFSSFAPLCSLNNPTDGILDLKMCSRLSPHSSGLDAVSIEPIRQAGQQPALRDSAQQELFNLLDSLSETPQCHSARPSSSSDSLHTAIPASTNLFPTSIHPSSSSSSLFSPSLTPSSSSSSLSLFSSLSPSDQHPFANCSDDTAINAKEVLSSMLRSSSDSRQSVIHLRVHDSEHLS